MKWHTNLLQGQRGFTLIESLLSLYILTFVSTLIIMLLSTLFFQMDNATIQPLEWENFIIQSQSELREVNDWWVDNDIIHFTSTDNEHVTYSLYKNVIRRQVNGTGHEVLLQNVGMFSCNKLENGVELIVTDTNGQVLTRNIYRLGE